MVRRAVLKKDKGVFGGARDSPGSHCQVGVSPLGWTCVPLGIQIAGASQEMSKCFYLTCDLGSFGTQ